MIIVYNLTALLTTIISAALFGLIYWLAPNGTFDSGSGVLTFAAIVTVLSALVEKEMKPRVFWLPLTLWGFALLTLGIFAEYGNPAFAIFMTLSGLLGAYILYRYFKGFKERWILAQARLVEIRQMPHDPNSKELWWALCEALYLPRQLHYSKEVCAHNLEVATIIGTLVSPEEYQTHVEGYKTHIAKGLEKSDFIYNMSERQLGNLLQLLAQKAKDPTAPAVLAVAE